MCPMKGIRHGVQLTLLQFLILGPVVQWRAGCCHTVRRSRAQVPGQGLSLWSSHVVPVSAWVLFLPQRLASFVYLVTLGCMNIVCGCSSLSVSPSSFLMLSLFSSCYSSLVNWFNFIRQWRGSMSLLLHSFTQRNEHMAPAVISYRKHPAASLCSSKVEENHLC